MVNNTTITFLVISVILCFIAPIIMTILVRRQSKKLFMPIFLGVTTYFVMQVLFRLPIISSLQLTNDFSDVNIFLYSSLLALSAALVETIGRFVTMKFFMRNDKRFTAAMAHGIGHGGIEALFLVGVPYITYIMYATMINNGSLELAINDAYPSNRLLIEFLTETLIDNPSYLFLLGGIERVLTILLHISLSVLIMYVIRSKNYKAILLVIGVQTFFEFSVSILNYYSLNMYLVQVYIFLFVIGMLYMTWKILRQYFTTRKDENDV